MEKVIGNVYDLNDLEFDQFVNRLRHLRRQVRGPSPARPARPSVRGPVLDAQTGELEDESGLTMNHTVAPETLTKLSSVFRGGSMIAVGLSFLAGLVLAAVIWWFSNNTQQQRALPAPRRRR